MLAMEGKGEARDSIHVPPTLTWNVLTITHSQTQIYREYASKVCIIRAHFRHHRVCGYLQERHESGTCGRAK